VEQALIVFAAAAVTALATGLGAVPFAFRRFRGEQLLGVANAVASGVMLGASASLLYEGYDRSLSRTAVGALAGVAFVWAAQALLTRVGAPELGSLDGAGSTKALLIVGVMFVHSVSEGVGVGSSYGGGDALGLAISVAIAIHNIPEGVAISLVLVPRGVRVRTAAVWSIFSSVPQPLLAVPAFLFVEQFAAVLPAALGFAAGAMVWMVLHELLPEALRETSPGQAALAGGVSFAAMLAFQTLLLAA
jgi:zinc transporter ZupT